ncbi:thymidine phosphorylase [Trichonephila clavata]|uniref:Thymidine phosphorylase n=1 Tax=Trichonephila clavata TaxID=2740835 RepID=A0A8X6IT44_TRICU|nr:thymidine phosphorylase [Trichonephila clavata]
MGDFKLLKIIEKKRDGKTLTSEDIGYFVDSVKKTLQYDSRESFNNDAEGIADRSQIGAMLMAIYLKGLNDFETNQLTLKMRDSGHIFQWSDQQKSRIVDKHSTGGVGDKISLILVPALAACGLLIPMISGRSLGHTGGTLEKLESIKQLSTSLEENEILSAIDSIGCCIVGQTEECVPADKVLYCCRDMTATVDCAPLVIASIVSKKLSENPGAIIYDVKFGKAAFFKTLDAALEIAIGLVKASRPVKAVALLTSVDNPLGRSVGNSLEILESVECLRGSGPRDIIQLVEALGAELLQISIGGSKENIYKTLSNGEALKKFHDMLLHQHTDKEVAQNLCYGDASEVFKEEAPYKTNFTYSGEEGFVSAIDPLVLGNIWKDEYVYSLRNPGVGFLILKTIGDDIRKGDVWLEFHHQREEITQDHRTQLTNAITVSSQRVQRKLIEKKVYYRDDALVVEDY